MRDSHLEAAGRIEAATEFLNGKTFFFFFSPFNCGILVE